MWLKAMRVTLSILLSAMPWVAAAAPGVPHIAMVTIVDGGSVLIRGAARLSLAEGVRLAKDDIIETGVQGRLVRIEFTDGGTLDLGPDSRALLAPQLPASRSKSPAHAYLLQGWAKWTAAQPPATPTAGVLLSAALDASATGRTVVALLGDDSFAFVEAGETVLAERRAGRALAPTPLKSDQFYARLGEAKPVLAKRPTPAFIQRVPRAFLDTLPTRAELLKAKNVVPKPLGDITYADVQAWVNAEAPLRTAFVSRWRAQAKNADFRKGLLADLPAHPEWDRVLNPQKYLPKPASTGDARY